jgi:hypothetical protein
LKGLVVNYSEKETSKHKGTIYHKSLNQIKKQIPSFTNLTFVNNKFSTEEVCAITLSVRFILLPSDADASPRLIVEPLVRDRPLVVNSAIYGGWKYINDQTGTFFDAPSIEECVNDKYKKDYSVYENSLKLAIEKALVIKQSGISSNFYEKYGFLNSSKKLAEIINSFSNTKYKAVAFKEWEKQLKKISKII